MPKKLKSPVTIKFKFEPDQKWWGRAYIFPTNRGMIRALKYDNIDPGASPIGGLCCNYRKVLKFEKNKRAVDTGQVCTIYLNEEDLTVETIAHETAHACMGWAHRVKLSWTRTHRPVRVRSGQTWVDQDGERWAYAVGRVAEQITLAYQRRVFKKK